MPSFFCVQLRRRRSETLNQHTHDFYFEVPLDSLSPNTHFDLQLQWWTPPAGGMRSGPRAGPESAPVSVVMVTVSRSGDVRHQSHICLLAVTSRTGDITSGLRSLVYISGQSSTNEQKMSKQRRSDSKLGPESTLLPINIGSLPWRK